MPGATQAPKGIIEMIVNAVKIEHPRTSTLIHGYTEFRARSVKYCCDKMKEAWEDAFIGFGEYDSILHVVDKVCIYHCHPWPEGAAWDEMPICCCPFCGEGITISVENA